jgi:hypothetical protein
MEGNLKEELIPTINGKTKSNDQVEINKIKIAGLVLWMFVWLIIFSALDLYILGIAPWKNTVATIFYGMYTSLVLALFFHCLWK